MPALPPPRRRSAPARGPMARRAPPRTSCSASRCRTGEGERLILVRSEGVRGGAGIADRCGCVQAPQGDGHAPVGQQALNVVQAIRSALDLDEPTERAPLDPLRREPVRIGFERYRRQRQGHGREIASRAWTNRERGLAPDSSTAPNGAATSQTY